MCLDKGMLTLLFFLPSKENIFFILTIFLIWAGNA